MKIALLALMFMTNAFCQIVITDSGSTNRMGMSVTLGSRRSAVIEDRKGTKTKMKMDAALYKRFTRDVQAAAPLDQLPASHCMKSVSFGSSTFITYQGLRSPDLSCPGQADHKAAALQKDLNDIMAQVHQVAPPVRPDKIRRRFPTCTHWPSSPLRYQSETNLVFCWKQFGELHQTANPALPERGLQIEADRRLNQMYLLAFTIVLILLRRRRTRVKVEIDI